MVEKNTLLIARVFLSLVFLVSGIRQILNYQVSVLSLGEQGVPLSGFVLMIGIAAQFLGGIFLILGYKTRTAAAGLIIFLVLANLIYHRDLTNLYNQLQVTKDMAIIGGLLYVYWFGAGEISVDARKKPAPIPRKKKKK